MRPVILVFAAFLIFLALAPWMDGREAASRYIVKIYQKDGMSEEEALMIAQTSPEAYSVSWAPFGRVVTPKEDGRTSCYTGLLGTWCNF
ncbi:MAG TPA: hypothetical protein VLD37_03235 [Candidatus Bilamarchaeum sp.]|nr:hypothetical protein [Candidatus Bilamarchaeum sp.]